MTPTLFSSAQTSLPEVYFQVWESGTVSHDARRTMKRSLLDGEIDSADIARIDRLVYAVRSGRISMAR